MASGNDVELLQELSEAREALEQQVARRIVGQKEIVEKLLISLLAGGHALVVGVPVTRYRPSFVRSLCASRVR